MNESHIKEYILSNPYASELEHSFSYSEKHHVFNITIMCIKYKVDILEDEILSIDFHEDYSHCFEPLLNTQNVSTKTRGIASSIIAQYLNENLWLKGWIKNWNNLYSDVWNKNMERDPINKKFRYANSSDSFNYYIFKNKEDTTLLSRIN